jgi:3-keto-5-aminohexanoate cleavage enzyme
MTRPLIISAAICGGEHTRTATPHLPQTPREIADSAYAAYEAGAAIAHVHVWDEHGRPTQDPHLYREIYRLLGERCDMVVNITTGPGGHPSEDERMLPLALRPELASFDAGSMNFGEGVFLNSPDFLRRLATRMARAGTKPELEIFDTAMIENCLRLAAEGLLSEPLYFQFVLGVRGGAPANARTLAHLVDSLPPGSQWSATGIGQYSVEVALMALAMGGHVRVGLEDSIYYRRGELATSNAQLVARIARLAQEVGRPMATPSEARALLNLSGGPTLSPYAAQRAPRSDVG